MWLLIHFRLIEFQFFNESNETKKNIAQSIWFRRRKNKFKKWNLQYNSFRFQATPLSATKRLNVLPQSNRLDRPKYRYLFTIYTIKNKRNNTCWFACSESSVYGHTRIATRVVFAIFAAMCQKWYRNRYARRMRCMWTTETKNHVKKKIYLYKTTEYQLKCRFVVNKVNFVWRSL